METENDGKERRKAPRKSFVVPIKICNTNSKLGCFLSGLSRDISMVGVALESADKLDVGEKYNFEVILSDKKKISPAGKIVWATKRENTLIYGISFLNLNIFDRIKLAKHIRVLSKI